MRDVLDLSSRGGGDEYLMRRCVRRHTRCDVQGAADVPTILVEHFTPVHRTPHCWELRLRARPAADLKGAGDRGARIGKGE